MPASVFKYPKIRRDEKQTETLFGNTIADPYRWLEDPESTETKTFIEQQNQLTFDYLNGFKHKEQFRESLTRLYDYERRGCPFKRGDCYYYFYNSGLQAQSVLMKQKTLDSQAEVFFDPNKLSKDGTAALNTYSFSETGKYFAYGVSYSGSDWVTIFIKDVETGKQLEEKIEWAKFTGITWLHDDSGFFYNRYPEQKVNDKGTETDANLNGMLFFHQLNTQQINDLRIIKDDQNPEYMFGSEVTDDGRYLMVTISESCDPVNKLYVLDLKQEPLKQDSEFMKVINDFSAEYSYVTNNGNQFIFKTNLNAPKYRVIQFDLQQRTTTKELIPQNENVLERVSCVAEHFLICQYLEDVKNTLYVYDFQGSLKTQIPVEIGSIDSLTGRRKDRDLFFRLISFINPGVIYRFNFPEFKPQLFHETKIKDPDYRSADFEMKQIFYQSKDGTRIPMFLIGQKGLQLNGLNPTLLYGYGGFNISITPSFSPAWLTFMKHMNGLVAVANIRGGGEYGEEWHKAGSLLNKQNCFDDFQWAAKYLIREKYTTASKLAINGGSNGGLLVGACINQQPDLYGCAMADVGVMDLLRFHKFTIGHAWKSDYGNPDIKKDFDYIFKYSPLQNVRSGNQYPATLLLTSDHDDRVVPLHSYKYIAELQFRNPDNKQPLLIRIETKAGHGAGKPTQKRIDEATDLFSFLAQALQVDYLL